MNIHSLIFLFLLATITSNIDAFSAIPQSKSSIPKLTQKKRPDNETIYKVSKQLCHGCTAEKVEFLFRHNLVRATKWKWELPLKWNLKLEKHARQWARQRKTDCKLKHSFPDHDFKLGENIFWGSGSAWTPTDAVRYWADEEKYYTYANNTCAPGQMCGHYTQIVWKNTKRVGCARVICDDGDVFITCNYHPLGNYFGKRPY